MSQCCPQRGCFVETHQPAVRPGCHPYCLILFLCRVCYCYHAATLCWLKCVLDQSTWVLLACTPFAYDFQSYVSCSCATPVAHCCLLLANCTSALGVVCHDVVSICSLSISCCSSRHASSFFCPFARSACLVAVVVSSLLSARWCT